LSSTEEEDEFDFVIWSGLLQDLEYASSHINEEQVYLFHNLLTKVQKTINTRLPVSNPIM
jgi:hypothetical protein